ncbi:MAG: SPOR domain-containing protein [Bacteroidales bacterium]|nr:SPOR domain-containing protein [Bacteroidales bacterium]
MKYIIGILLVSLVSFNVYSQNYTKKKTITEELKTPSRNGGSVNIFQDPILDSLINKQVNNFNQKIGASDMVITGKGYRIQIFSSNNQRQAKSEADAMAFKLKELYPDLDTYVRFNSPFWKLRVGNYRTLEEAHAVLRELKKSFPKWKEMFIVDEVIEFPLKN